MNKKIALVIFVVLLIQNTIIGQESEQEYVQIYSSDSFWNQEIIDYNTIQWQYVPVTNYNKVDWSKVTDYTQVQVEHIPNNKWGSCETCVNQKNIKGKKVADIPPQYFSPAQVDKAELKNAIASQIEATLEEISKIDLDLVSFKAEEVKKVFESKYKVNLDIGTATTVKFDTQTGILDYGSGSYNPSKWPSDVYKQVIEGNVLKIIPLTADKKEDTPHEITVSCKQGCYIEPNDKAKDGSLKVTLKENQEIVITGPNIHTVSLEDGTTFHIKNQEGGSATIKGNGDLKGDKTAIAIVKEFQLTDTLEKSKSIIDIFNAQGFGVDNFNARKAWYEFYTGNVYNGLGDQNPNAIKEIVSRNMPTYITEIWEGSFEVEHDAALLNSYDGKQSSYKDLLIDFKTTTIGYPLVVVKDNGQPPSNWKYDGGFVTYSYKDVEKSFISIGAADVEYDGVHVKSKDTIDDFNQFFSVTSLIERIQSGDESALEVLLDPERKTYIKTSFSFHNINGNGEDYCYGLVSYGSEDLKYKGLTVSSQFQRAFNAEKDQDQISINGAADGEIAKLEVRVLTGDLEADEFISGQVWIPLKVSRSGDDVVINVKAQELVKALGQFTNPDKFIFALLEHDTIILLGDKEDESYFAINKDMGMVYYPSEGNPTSVLTANAIVEYLGGKEHESRMIAQALINYRNEQTNLGYVVGDTVQIKGGMTGKIVAIRPDGSIIVEMYSSRGEKTHVTISEESDIIGGVDEGTLAYRRALLENKKVQTLKSLDEYENKHTGEDGGLARIEKYRLMTAFDMPLKEKLYSIITDNGMEIKTIFKEGETVNIHGKELHVLQVNYNEYTDEIEYVLSNMEIISENILVNENWFGQLKDDYSSYTGVLQEGSDAIAESLLLEGDISGAKRFYQYVIDADPSSDSAEKATRTMDKITTHQIVQLMKIGAVKTKIQEIISQAPDSLAQPKSIISGLVGGTDFFEYISSKIAGMDVTVDNVVALAIEFIDSTAPAHAVKALNLKFALSSIQDEFDKTNYVADLITELVDSGYTSDITESADLIKGMSDQFEKFMAQGSYAQTSENGNAIIIFKSFDQYKQDLIKYISATNPEFESAYQLVLSDMESYYDVNNFFEDYGYSSIVERNAYIDLGINLNEYGENEQSMYDLILSERSKGHYEAAAFLAQHLYYTASDPEIRVKANEEYSKIRGEGWYISDKYWDVGVYDLVADLTNPTWYLISYGMSKLGEAVLNKLLTAMNVPEARNAMELSFGICFVAGTKITMYDGSLKNIEDIKAGDIVLSYDANNKQYAAGKVINAFERENDDLIIINEKIKTTPEHSFFIINKNAYIKAEDLSIGDVFLCSNGNISKVETLKSEKLKQKIKVYNFDVKYYDNYFANSVLVHNDCTVKAGKNSHPVADNLLQRARTGRAIINDVKNYKSTTTTIVTGNTDRRVTLFRGTGAQHATEITAPGYSGKTLQEARQAYKNLPSQTKLNTLYNHIDELSVSQTLDYPSKSLYISATDDILEAIDYAKLHKGKVMKLSIPENNFFTIETIGYQGERIVEMAIPAGIKQEWIVITK